MIVEKIIVKIKDYTLVNNKCVKELIALSAQYLQILSITMLIQHPIILKSSKS